MSSAVSDNLIEKIVLYNPCFWFSRLDVFPFLIAYFTLFYCVLVKNNLSVNYCGYIGLPLGFGVHLLLFMLSQWSVKIKCIIGHNISTDAMNTKVIHVSTAKNSGTEKLVTVKKTHNWTKFDNIKIVGNIFELSQISFQFQKVCYGLNVRNNVFEKVKYPTSGSIDSYLNWSGHINLKDATLSLQKWGMNEFDIPIPNFLDLYMDHLVAPFFVFQVLCLFLWSLDDYWYYSAFTLLMLMFFEGMMCRQRQASLTMLRNMRRPPMQLLVFRGAQWTPMSSDLVVPGDVISLSSVPVVVTGRHRNTADKPEVLVPCDVLLIRGSCVMNEAMLTGESVPQVKESLANVEDRAAGFVDLGSESTIDPIWRRHMLFSGTSLMLHNPCTEADVTPDRSSILVAPDGGCVAVVVRTGFGTCQGGLMRKILFATERVTGNNSSETFYFIGVLVVFAVLAAGSVLIGGLRDEKRNKFRLVLHCIMIVTSVVPPELPMELSLAVTNSLAALSRGLVYCTEPFRISFAGKLDVLCFDKTGTLTKDEMILRGVVAPQDLSLFATISNIAMTGSSSSSRVLASGRNSAGDDELDPMPSLTADPNALHTQVFEASLSFDVVCSVMGGCHDLIPRSSAVSSNGLIAMDRGKPIGDPLELAALQSSGFAFEATGRTVGLHSLVNSDRGLRVTVKHKFPFSSALKRMSVVVEIECIPTKANINYSGSNVSSSKSLCVFTKGAPEVLHDLLIAVPEFFTATYRYHMSKGRRVLAMACKKMPFLADLQGIRSKSRADVECQFEFVGFLVFDCDLKADSKSVVRELRSSNHRVVMITGDSAFTAADVARKLGMLVTNTSKLADSTLTLRMRESSLSAMDRLVWCRLSDSDDEEGVGVKYLSNAVNQLSSECSLCVTGPELTIMEQSLSGTEYWSFLKLLCPHITIFARVSPSQKESIVLALNDSGLFTLMCGDGTNDVGALKAAHVGISVVNNPDFERKVELIREQDSSTERGKKPKGASAKDRMTRALKELQEQEADPTIVKLGDASIASSFTARRTSIDSVLTVIRQGRCTLVTTIQVYKILALNCLVSAFMMSALYMRGLKQGDTQMTSSGLIVAGLFFFLSQAKPLQRISPEKPPSSIFAFAVGLSILGQFIVHLISLVAVLYLCEMHVASDSFSVSPDGKFQPNVVNSSVFLLSALMQINNFVVNYRGHPFTQSITENVTLWRSIQLLYALLLIVAGGQVQPLNDILQMAPFPSSEFQGTLIAILVFNFSLSYFVEKLCQKLE